VKSLSRSCGAPAPLSCDDRRREEASPLRVGFFITCLVDLMRPEIAESAVKLLEAAGCTVEVPMTQTCCGQPGYNSGDAATARALARKALEEFERFDHVVVPSGSCGGMIRHHYPALFADDPDLKVRIEALAAKTWELTAFLHEVAQLRELPGRFEGEVTYHDSCAGLRELGVQAQPRALLALNPAIRVTEMKDARACCGFGGTFSVKYGDISTAIVDEKLDRIRASGAGCVVLGDLGCMLNIEGRLRRTGDTTTRVLHVAQVLAGDVPPAPAAAGAAPPAPADAGTPPAVPPGVTLAVPSAGAPTAHAAKEA
jgi:L-lactate dehydrogenase complex protein LldE